MVVLGVDHHPGVKRRPRDKQGNVIGHVVERPRDR
jgi:hypothetical protein